MTDSFDLQGRVALITGGSRGLGREMGLAFARRGARIAVVSRKQEACEETAEEIRAAGGEALAVACHVADWDACGAMVEQVWGHFGRIDVLVNNAGMSPLYPSLDQVSEALFDKVIGVNLKGPSGSWPTWARAWPPATAAPSSTSPPSRPCSRAPMRSPTAPPRPA
jgi:Dehydrogenases with different specificities (related to short-chain alcohol dehydrogenases)